MTAFTHPTGRLHRLEPDPLTAPVVARIFAEYLDGRGYYAIAERLTADAVPSPAGHDRARNRHRHGRAWGKSAVRAILANPRYTGYQVWGRQRRDEVLLDVDDVAAGHTSRRRWNPATQWIWSAAPAHRALVSRAAFQAVQARMHPPTPHKPRKAQPDARVYPLRGRLRCQLCDRRLQGQWIRGEAYYRCRYPAEYATTAGFDHPRSVYLREVDLLPRIDAWLGRLTDPDHLEATCQAIAAASDQPATRSSERAAARQVVADCERRLARYRAALEAGTDPTVVGQWIAEVTATRQATETSLRQLDAAPEPLSPGAIRAALEEVGGLAAALDGADPVLRAQLYEELGIEGTYDPAARVVAVRADLRRPMVRVGGATRTPTPTECGPRASCPSPPDDPDHSVRACRCPHGWQPPQQCGSNVLCTSTDRVCSALSPITRPCAGCRVWRAPAHQMSLTMRGSQRHRTAPAHDNAMRLIRDDDVLVFRRAGPSPPTQDRSADERPRSRAVGIVYHSSGRRGYRASCVTSCPIRAARP
jgi:site-specific DNA recombinase